MKKIISLALATLLCAAVFVGCGSNENKATGSSKSTSSSSVSKRASSETSSFSRSTSSTKASENNIFASSSSTMSNEKLPTIINNGGSWSVNPSELATAWEKHLPSGYDIKKPGQSPDDSSKYISRIDNETAIVFSVDSSKCVNNVYIQYKKEYGKLTENDKNRVEEYVSALMQTVNSESTPNRLSEIKTDMLMTDDNTFGAIIRDNIMFRFKQQSDNWIVWTLKPVDQSN